MRTAPVTMLSFTLQVKVFWDVDCVPIPTIRKESLLRENYP